MVCLVVQRTHDFIGSKDINGIIITLGWLVSPLLNLLVSIVYLSKFLSKKPLGVPMWLAMSNVFFMVLQIFIHFILPS